MRRAIANGGRIIGAFAAILFRTTLILCRTQLQQRGQIHHLAILSRQGDFQRLSLARGLVDERREQYSLFVNIAFPERDLLIKRISTPVYHYRHSTRIGLRYAGPMSKVI